MGGGRWTAGAGSEAADLGARARRRGVQRASVAYPSVATQEAASFSASTPALNNLCAVTLGYFLYDTVFMVLGMVRLPCVPAQPAVSARAMPGRLGCVSLRHLTPAARSRCARTSRTRPCCSITPSGRGCARMSSPMASSPGKRCCGSARKPPPPLWYATADAAAVVHGGMAMCTAPPAVMVICTACRGMRSEGYARLWHPQGGFAGIAAHTQGCHGRRTHAGTCGQAAWATACTMS